MITGRNVILGAIVISVVALTINFITLMKPLDNEGMGNDSYGVYPSGNRALVEIMQALELPVERSHSPGDPRLTPDSTFVLVGPDIYLMEREEALLGELEAWVDSGGRLVVGFTEGLPSLKFLQTFALEEVQFIDFETGEPLYNMNQLETAGAVPPSARRFIERFREEEQDRSLEDDFTEIMTHTSPQRVRVEIAECTGNFQALCRSVGSLALREDKLIALETAESHPLSSVSLEGADEPRTLIAEYKRGAGSVILVGDVSLFHNLSFREGDNSVLLVNLLSEGRDLVLFDEFFHGLSIRGNPIWIFAQPGYRWIALLLLLTVGLFIWHEFPAFGMIHPPKPASRRSLDAYLDAVSRLLLGTRTQREQLLVESEKAFLWKLARSLHLAGERNQREAIINRLRRTNPELLEEFEAIMAQFQRCHQHGCSTKELLELLRRSHRCLS